MKELTLRQREVLGFITDYIRVSAYPPTIREIGDHFAISVKGAYDHVDALRKKGIIRLGNRRSRTIEVIKAGGNTENSGAPLVIEVPLLGTVAAGRPILSDENWEGFIPIHCSLLKANARYFALKVRGDSMIGAGIQDGDIAVIEKREHAENREIVVALVDDEAVTLKRFFREATRIRLEPENPEHKPIYTQDVRILGRLATIIRSY
ncbi:MAG: transcriptional repressor LexA [Treponema sp.]|jgi:repressor LexA|nr:transcriptional repressor LexA [Treponema sp.]